MDGLRARGADNNQEGIEVKKNIGSLLAIIALAASAVAHADTEWSAQDYDLYSGDFDGDGQADLLYIAKDPSKVSGIARSTGGGPTVSVQTWPSNYLGIPWYGNTYTVSVADFSGDGKADILLQRNGSGDHYLLFADGQGKITGISQVIPEPALGYSWSSSAHKIIAGDFNGDHHADVFLQSTTRTGANVVIYSDSNGQFTTSAVSPQSWNNSYLGLEWSVQDAVVSAGNFDGVNGSDLLVRARPRYVTIDYDIPITIPVYPANKNAVVLSQAGSPFFQLSGVLSFNRKDFGVAFNAILETGGVAVGEKVKLEVEVEAVAAEKAA